MHSAVCNVAPPSRLCLVCDATPNQHAGPEDTCSINTIRIKIVCKANSNLQANDHPSTHILAIVANPLILRQIWGKRLISMQWNVGNSWKLWELAKTAHECWKYASSHLCIKLGKMNAVLPFNKKKIYRLENVSEDVLSNAKQTVF